MGPLIGLAIGIYIGCGIVTVARSLALAYNPYEGFDALSGIFMMLVIMAFWPIALLVFLAHKQQT